MTGFSTCGHGLPRAPRQKTVIFCMDRTSYFSTYKCIDIFTDWDNTFTCCGSLVPISPCRTHTDVAPRYVLTDCRITTRIHSKLTFFNIWKVIFYFSFIYTNYYILNILLFTSHIKFLFKSLNSAMRVFCNSYASQSNISKCLYTLRTKLMKLTSLRDLCLQYTIMKKV